MKYSSATDVVRRIKVCLAMDGFDVERLFSEAGLEMFEQSDDRSDDILALSDKFSHLWETLAEVSGDPMLGFRVSSPHPLSWLGMLGHIMLASPNLKVASESLVRYMPLVSPTVHATIEQKPERTMVSLHLVGGNRAVPQQRYDFTWSMLLSTMRFVSGRPDLNPVMVAYAFAQPASAQAYIDKYGCPVRFGAPRNIMEFSNADLVAPIPTSNTLAVESMFRLLDERLAQAQRTSFSSKVQNLLVTMIDQGGALREAVAKRLLISERTLQRRLADEGTDFSALVDDVRREMAQQYLGSDKLTLKMLSYKLGFSDPSAFHRACLRWFGKPPGEFQQQRGAAAANRLLARPRPAPLDELSAPIA